MNREFIAGHVYALKVNWNPVKVHVAYKHSGGWALIYSYVDAPDQVLVASAATPEKYEEVLPDRIQQFYVDARGISIGRKIGHPYVEINYTKKTAVWVDNYTGKA